VPGPPPELRRGRGLSNRLSGAWGEELALRYLTQRGYELVERNYRTRYGELDLILRDEDSLVLVQMCKHSNSGFVSCLPATRR
jgi:putative endonuclease